MHPDDERRLAEAGRRLAADDPGLARVLATGRLSAGSDAVAVLGGGLTAFAAGLLIFLLGAQFAVPFLVVTGALLAVVTPAVLAAWRFRRR